MIIPHYFQIDAKNALVNYLEGGGKGNPLVCMPTGSGKSIVIADFLKDLFSVYPYARVMMLTHVWKLILQNAEKMQVFWPTAPIGIHSAGLKQRDTLMPIIFGGVQSVVKNVEAFGHRDILLIDEAHLLGPDEDSAYQEIIKRLTAINPYLKVAGFTATPYRMKMGLLTEGELFSDVVFNITTHEWFTRLVNEGYLSPLIGKPTATKIDISNVGIVGGDFNAKQAEDAIDREDIIYNGVKELLDYGYNRNKCMVFAAGVKNAEHIAECMQSFGASVAAVHSKMDPGEVKRRLEAYDKGDLWGIVGANMLTTGYDNPKIDLIADFQPTCSPGKHVQKLGRGTRVYRGNDWQKENCLYLDFVGNVSRNGPIDDPVMPRKPGQKTGEPPPIKICETHRLVKVVERTVKGCGAYNHASLRYCCNCAEAFIFESKILNEAQNVHPMKQEENPQIDIVPIKHHVFYAKHNGKDKGNGIVGPPTVKATYVVGIRPVNVFLCFEHTGKARRLAHEWWMRHSSNPPPDTCDEFLRRTNELRVPKSVTVHSNLKYPEILGYEF